MRRFYYFNSTHWDREWYQSFQEFRKYLLDTTEILLDIFERRPDYRQFTFDGQTIVLEDILEIHPEWREKLSRLIADGKLNVGPWYVMPDEFLCSGESIIRNLQIGSGIAHKFGGEPWPVGYVCDVFGHIAQLPQLLSGFGLKGIVCWRGTPDFGSEHLLYWESPDGTRIPLLNLGKRRGYSDFTQSIRDGLPEPVDEQKFKEKFRDYVETNLNHWGDVFVLSDGLDHAKPSASTPDMLRWIAELYPESEVIHSDYADLFDREFPGKYPLIKGEQLTPAKSPHWSSFQISATLSSRYDVKLANDAAQNELQLLLEPQLSSLLLSGRKANLALWKYQWKLLLQNHAHDSICGCSVDLVHRAVLNRIEEVRAIGRMLNEDFIMTDEEQRLRPESILTAPRVFEAAEDGVYCISLYNPLPWKVAATREIEIEFPCDKAYPQAQSEPFGYEVFNSFRIYDATGTEIPYQLRSVRRNRNRAPFRQFCRRYDIYTVVLKPELRANAWTRLTLRPSENSVRSFASLRTSPFSAENGLTRVDIRGDGSVDIRDLRTGRIYRGLNNFVIDREIGDGWNHVAPMETAVAVQGALSSIKITTDGPERVEFAITRRWELPREVRYTGNMNQSYDTISESGDTAELELTTFIAMDKDSPLLRWRVELNNTVRDYRLKIKFPTGMAGDYFAGQAFTMVERPEGRTEGGATENWREPEMIDKNFDGIIGRRSAEGGIAVLSPAGLHEGGADYGEDHALSVTLLRAFRRTVRTNGESEGELPGRRVFELGLLLFDGREKYSDLYRRLLEMRMTVPTETAPAALWDANQSDVSRLTISGDVVFSCVKPLDTLENDAVLVRVFNPNATAEQAEITLPGVTGAARCRLDEQEISALPVIGNKVPVTVGPGEIFTLRLNFHSVE